MLYLPEKHDDILITSSRPFGTETVFAKAPEGLSLSQILWNGPQPKNLPIVIEAWIDGKPVPCELWESVYPKAGQLVAFKALPTGGALRSVLMILVMIVAVITQQYWALPLATALGISVGTATTLGIMAVSVVGSLIINALIPPTSPKTSDFSTTNDVPTQWISGGQNSINKWGAVPVVLGSHRTTPFYGTKPYTEIVGNDQYLRVLFVIGYGPLQITDLKIGDAAIDTFQDVETEIRSGYAGDDPITLIPGQVNELGLQILLVNTGDGGTWNSQTTEEDIDEFSIDWSFPSGLVYINPLGTKMQMTVSLEARYRKVGVEEWTYVGDTLAVLAAQRTLQSSWIQSWIGGEGGELIWIIANRVDAICIRKDTSGIQIFQSDTLGGGGTPRPPVIDTVNYYELAEITVNGDAITSIVDKRDPTYVTGCAVTLSAGLTVDIASGTVANVDRLKTVAASTSAVRRTLTIIPPEQAQYEIELRRITADSTDIQIADKVYWIVLRSINHEEPIDFPYPLAKVAMRIKATDQLGGVIDTFNCIATSIVKDFDGAGDANSLLHFNGTNNSTVITDEYGEVWTVSGDAHLNTGDKVFGNASLELDGAGDYVKNVTITSFGDKFTIEGRFHIDNIATDDQVLFSGINSVGDPYGIMLRYASGTKKFAIYLSSNGTSWNIVSGSAGTKVDWVNDTWYDWIIEFDGADYKVYFGEAGVPVTLDIDVASSDLIYSPLSEIAIGRYLNNYLDGGIDEFRITTGRSRYGYAITPETEEFTTWPLRPTNNPASLYRYVLQGVPNTKPQADAKLDLSVGGFFETFWQWCKDENFAYNAVTASAKSVFEQCVEICAAGRCSPQRDGEGKWAGVIDQSGKIITGHYAPHNSWNLEFSGIFPTLPHGMRVAFIDETNGFQQQERIVYDDGYDEDNATLFEAVAQQGVTHPDQIFKLWRYNIACTKLRPFPFSFMVDWEHLTNTRGDLIRVSYYELSGQLFSGHLKSVTEVMGEHVLELDNTVIMAEGKSYAIRIRQQDGTTLTGDIQTDVGEVSTITTYGLLAPVPNIGDLFQFGELLAESIPAIIKSIEPVDKLCARVVCLDYAEGVFSADTESIPEWNPVVTLPYFADNKPSVPEITNVVSDESVIQRDPGGRFRFRIAVNFRYISSTKVNAHYVQAQYCQVSVFGHEIWETSENISILAGVLFIPDVKEGAEYKIRIRALTNIGLSSEWSTPYLETVVGRTSVPDNVTGFNHSFTKKGILLTWDRLMTLDIKHYELRSVGNSTWENGTLIAKVDSDFYEWIWQTIGICAVGIKAIDFLDLESEEATFSIITLTPPQKPTDLTAQTIHNQVQLSWECLQGSFPIDHYKIYKDAVLIGTVGGNFCSLFEDEEGTYVYTILAVDSAGNEGASESISVQVDEPFGFVLGQEEALTLSGGTFANAFYDSATQGIYMPVDILSSYAEMNLCWETWQAKITAGYPYWLQPTCENGEWLSETCDVGEIVSSSKIMVNLTTTIMVAGCTIKVYIQYSLNGVDWTEMEGISITATNFRYYRIRITAEQTGFVGFVKLN